MIIKFKYPGCDDAYISNKYQFYELVNRVEKPHDKYRAEELAHKPEVTRAERRLDSLSRILNGSDICTAIAFDTKRNCFKYANNSSKYHESEQIKNSLVEYLNDINENNLIDLSIKILFNKNLNNIFKFKAGNGIRRFLKKANKTSDFTKDKKNEFIEKYNEVFSELLKRSHGQFDLKAFDESQKEGLYPKIMELMDILPFRAFEGKTDIEESFNLFKRLQRDIKKLKKSVNNPSAAIIEKENLFTESEINALKTGNIKPIETESEFRASHAEMKLLQYFVEQNSTARLSGAAASDAPRTYAAVAGAAALSGKRTYAAAARASAPIASAAASADKAKIYFGISKLCCYCCQKTIEKFNELKSSELGFALKARGNHGMVYPWAEPEIVANNSELKAQLIEDLEAIAPSLKIVKEHVQTRAIDSSSTSGRSLDSDKELPEAGAAAAGTFLKSPKSAKVISAPRTPAAGAAAASDTSRSYATAAASSSVAQEKTSDAPRKTSRPKRNITRMAAVAQSATKGKAARVSSQTSVPSARVAAEKPGSKSVSHNSAAPARDSKKPTRGGRKRSGRNARGGRSAR